MIYKTLYIWRGQHSNKTVWLWTGEPNLVSQVSGVWSTPTVRVSGHKRQIPQPRTSQQNYNSFSPFSFSEWNEQHGVFRIPPPPQRRIGAVNCLKFLQDQSSRKHWPNRRMARSQTTTKKILLQKHLVFVPVQISPWDVHFRQLDCIEVVDKKRHTIRYCVRSDTRTPTDHLLTKKTFARNLKMLQLHRVWSWPTGVRMGHILPGT